MATLKSNEIRKMNTIEREKKLMELKIELAKSRANAAKTGAAKTREIKKIIARIHTINTEDNNKNVKGGIAKR